MKNVVYFKDGIVEVKNLYSDKTASAGRKAYNAVCRASKAGYIARYCDPDKVEATKAEVLALATGAKPAASTEPVVTTTREEVVNLPVHMVVHTYAPDCHSTIQYKDRDKAAAAYRAAKAQVGSTLISVEAGYRTITVNFGDGKRYTYLTDKVYKTKTVTVETADGPKKATVVDQKILSVKELKALAAEHGKTIVDFFMTIDGRDMDGVYVYREMAEAREMANAFALPKSPQTYGYSTFSDDDVPW